MSYDVSIGDLSFNMTSNISGLFYDHIPAVDTEHRGGLHAIHEKTGKEAGAILRQAFEDIDKTRHRHWSTEEVGDKKFCALYDSSNGWGSTVGALIFLAQIMAACYENPDEIVHLCA